MVGSLAGGGRRRRRWSVDYRHKYIGVVRRQAGRDIIQRHKEMVDRKSSIVYYFI